MWVLEIQSPLASNPLLILLSFSLSLAPSQHFYRPLGLRLVWRSGLGLDGGGKVPDDEEGGGHVFIVFYWKRRRKVNIMLEMDGGYKERKIALGSGCSHHHHQHHRL